LERLVKYLYHKDQKLFIYINKKAKCKLLDFTMPKVTHLGGASFTILSCLLLYLFGQEESKIASAEAFITLITSQSIVQIFKNKIYRKRPYMVINGVNTFWNKLLKDYSFPSGHTTAGFSLAVIFSIHFPAYSLIIYPLATMVGVSRIYTGMHYPSDVLSGAFLGSIFAFVTHSVKELLI
jgi:undecaprenyl-diphosphatase